MAKGRAGGAREVGVNTNAVSQNPASLQRGDESMDKVLAEARTIIRHEVETAGYQVRQLLLFGSRARGEARADSDWDFYVIISADVDRKTRQRVASRICWKLAHMGIVADVFVQSERVVQERREDTGYLTYYVLKEGVPI